MSSPTQLWPSHEALDGSEDDYLAIATAARQRRADLLVEAHIILCYYGIRQDGMPLSKMSEDGLRRMLQDIEMSAQAHRAAQVRRRPR
jgi:hypothetical protein